MRRACAMVLMCVLGFAALGAQRMGGQGGTDEFVAYDVIVETGVGLGAWQVEVRPGEGMKLTGVEGGTGVYSEAAYYDEAALRGGRVVIGDFSLDEQLPSGRVRVARVHFFVRGGAGHVVGTLQTAGDAAGALIDARVEVVRVIDDEGDAS